MKTELREKALACVPIIFNLGAGAFVVWFGSGADGWYRDLLMIVGGGNFGVAMSWAVMMLALRAKMDKEFEAELNDFRLTVQAMRDEAVDSVVARAAREIEELTGGQFSIGREPPARKPH